MKVAKLGRRWIAALAPPLLLLSCNGCGCNAAILNKRGAYWKALDEGGAQERGLAKQFFAWADALQIEWPKTAASLRRVGERYEAYARREDAEAESR